MNSLKSKQLKKKIYLIRSNNTKIGGAENYLYRLSKALTKTNFSHQILYSPFPKFLPSWLRALLFNLLLIITKNDKFYYSLERITCADIYRAGDGVHKTFLSIEDKSYLNLLHPVYLFLEKKCFLNSKHIIANSYMVKKQIIDCYKISPKKIDVIYNGIELKNLDPSTSFDKLSREFSISKNHSIILLVGSGFKRKGVFEFLNIIAQLKSNNLKAFVVGKESNMSYYQKLSKKLGIENKIIFTGPRNDVEDFYSISDIFLLPTHYDPFSNVVLEAMNFENAVFTTSFNGASEILDEEFIMKDPYDLRIISSIENLLSDKESLKKIKIKNKKTSENFSIEKNLLKTLSIIEQFE